MVAFVSDNVSAIHPKIFQAIADQNSAYRMPYGNDDLSKSLVAEFSNLFDTEVAVLACSSGTAANALALSLMAGPINSVCVHRNSHVYVDECNAPEFYTGGARLLPLDGADCKIDLAALELAATQIGEAHSPQPCAISLTQTTEVGSVYSIDEVNEITSFAKRHGLKTHMDGARFANAVAALDCHPADITWRAGIDALSFGATKNGAMAAEAVILFDQALCKEAAHRHKRAGQLLSKQRFLSAQLAAYIKDELWLDNARHANQQMTKLVHMLSSIESIELPENVHSNMIFAKFTEQQNQQLSDAGLAGYIFPNGQMRLCCSWATRDEELHAFVDCLSGD